MTAPKPKVVKEVCSLCGLDWKGHGRNPTAETCVKLLLDEVSSLNAQLAVRPFSRPYPYPVPTPYPVYPRPVYPRPVYPRPVYPRPYYPQWYTTYSQSSGGGTAPTPRAIAATSSAR